MQQPTPQAEPLNAVNRVKILSDTWRYAAEFEFDGGHGAMHSQTRFG
jgi:hypothetical protein